MSINKSTLASIIFDMDSKIKESDYSLVCEELEAGRFSLNEITLSYKKKTSPVAGYLEFKLNDGNNIIISEEFLDSLSNINIDKNQLIPFMSESKENFAKVIRVIYGNP